MDHGTDDDVMDTSPESHGDSDDVMDTSPVSCRNPNDVNPPVTHQYTDDIMDKPHETDIEADEVLASPPETHQNPDNTMDSPPLTNSEKYKENLNKDNFDPFVIDLTTKTEFHMKPTSAPSTSHDQDHGAKTHGTSNKAHGEFKVNVIIHLKIKDLKESPIEEPLWVTSRDAEYT